MDFSNWSKDWHLAQEFVFDSDFSRSSTTSTYSPENSPSDCNYECLSYYKTKEGSLKLQEWLVNSGPDKIEKFVSQISPVLSDFVVDPFANYAVQKLVECCTLDQRVVVIKELEGNLFAFACSPKGTHVIQTLVSLCSSPEEESLYLSLIHI